MKVNRLHRALMALLQAGLWNRPVAEEAVAGLTEADWKALFLKACAHTVQGVAFDGVKLLPSSCKPPREILVKWLLETQKVEEENLHMNRVLGRVSAEWGKRGIHPVLMKGQGIARMYRTPNHRVCGDIDWYFPLAEMRIRAEQWAVREGAQPETDGDGDVHYVWKGIIIEHHRTWIQLSKPSSRRYLLGLEKEMGFEEQNGLSVLSPVLNLLLLNMHVLKHALVMGIGWRQVCDMAVAYRFYHGKYDGKELKRVIGELGLNSWTNLLHEVLVKELGLEEEVLPFELTKHPDTSELVEQINQDGNMGMHREGANFKELSRWGRMKYMLRGLPAKCRLYSRYAPAEWVWRPLSLFAHRWKNTALMQEWGRCVWMWKQVKGYRKWIITSAFLELIAMLLSLAGIYFSKQAIDIATGAMTGDLWWMAGSMVACMATGIVLGIWAPWMTDRTFLKVERVLQQKLMNRLMGASWCSVQQWHTGDMLNRLTKDVDEGLDWVVYAMPTAFVTLCKLLASFGFLCMLDARIAWVILLSTPLLLFSKLYYKRMRALSKERKACESRKEAVMQESLVNRMFISALGGEENRQGLLDKEQTRSVELGLEQLRLGIYSKSVLNAVFSSGFFFTFWVGLYYLWVGWITFGALTAFIQLVGRIQGPVLQLIGFVPQFIKVSTAVDRMRELEGSERAHPRGEKLLKDLTALELNRVYFGYDRNLVVRNLNLSVERGESVAIVGPTGGGKTTLMRLVMGIVEPHQGDVQVMADGRVYHAREVNAKNFVYVPQGNSLFSGTIRSNLLWVKPDASEEECREVLSLACADFVWKLPQQLDTVVGEKGMGLSEGQAQRLAIARALLMPGKVWVFDEVTSALDDLTSKQLMQNLQRSGQDKLMLFVTHDECVMNQCKKVIYMDKEKTRYHFEVAELSFDCLLPASWKVSNCLPSFKPFYREGGTDSPAFTLVVNEQNEQEGQREGRLIEKTDSDLGHVELFATDSGYAFYLGYDEKITIHQMTANKDFSCVNAWVCPDDPHLATVLTSMVRIVYSQRILAFQGIAIHASTVIKDGKGFAFLGKSGTGKSTHSSLWRTVWGDEVELLNDDNPIVRVIEDDVWIYGSPWSGKTRCFKDKKVKLGGIVKLNQAPMNKCEIVKGVKAWIAVYPSCCLINEDEVMTDALHCTLNRVAEKVRIGMMDCLPDEEAARVCEKNMNIK